MGMSMVMWKQAHPLLNIPSGRGRINTPVLGLRPQKDKVVVVMGATGTGKSRLSIDLATQSPAEIVNSDKMQAYEGLDIVTNKITEEESRGVPHHLIGLIDPNADFTAANFCKMASLSLESIVNRQQLPIIVGGSNSYIEELVDNEDFGFRSRYECCFLWVDVSMPVLYSFLCKRVDQMVEAGMVDEARNMFDLNADYSRGIRRAIGVPELDQYFRAETCSDRLLQEAIQAIKDNTCKLACRQLEKIHRLRNVKGWKVHRLDATDVFRKRGKEADEAWEKLVAGPSTMIVDSFTSRRTKPVQRRRRPLELQPWQLQLTSYRASCDDLFHGAMQHGIGNFDHVDF
uniref:adenylate dimethylallyltransferase (ADP/ATP-dependent) n=1 Tax=Davidia involucrata TaxID=16924 RepID=A0A5B7AGS9_DAVIN